MKSKISNIALPDKPTYEYNGETFHARIVTLENGESGQVSSKAPDRWKVGDEVEYSVKDGQYGKKMSLKKPDAQPHKYRGGGNESSKYPSFAVAYAKDLVVAGKVELKDLEPTAKRILDILNTLSGNA